MKCRFNMFLFVMSASIVVFFQGAVISRAGTELQQQSPAVQAQAQEAEPEYSEEEYNCYDGAVKEGDLQKRGTMLIECIQKYPKSKLMTYIDAAYKTLLFECSNNKKYQDLEILAEQWLKLHPDDLQTIAYIASAAKNLGDDEKYVQCLLKIYKIQPTGSLASDIDQTYKKMKNRAKYIEWAETVFKYPEFDSDFRLRYDLMRLYMDSNDPDLPKAAELARITLKAADLVKEPSGDTQEQLRMVRRACYHTIGMSLFEKDQFAEAVKALQQAINVEKYGEGYYYIGLCQWKQDKVEDAMLSFARAEMQGGEVAGRAKEKLEQLYKAIHNNTLIGIDKIYKRAKEQPESAENLRQ
jgi:tetratricopeptide (TPR) repeat protein